MDELSIAERVTADLRFLDFFLLEVQGASESAFI